MGIRPLMRGMLVLWILVILWMVVPWRSFQDHLHWGSVQWIPFVSPPVRLLEIASNVILYVPFGALFAWTQPTRRGVLWRTLAWALLLSGLTEASQLFSHGRFPSVTDLVANVLGALIGARAAMSRRPKV
ncbi:MAG: VanZ family protein [Acidobacteriota bacterium]|nr:VanZ family protein [Acidobacteriota bacterium]